MRVDTYTEAFSPLSALNKHHQINNMRNTFTKRKDENITV